MLATSSLSVGCRNVLLLLSFERQSEKCLCEYFMLLFVVSAKKTKQLLKVLAIP